MRIYTFKSYIIYFLTISLFLHSCKSDIKNIENPEDKKNVAFAIEGILDEPITELSASTLNPLNATTKNEGEIVRGNGFVMETTQENTSNKSNFKNNLKALNKQSVTKMGIGIKLRLLIYEINTNGDEIFKSDIGAAVQANFYELSLVKNKKYKYYIYSYNNTDVYPPTPFDKENPVIPTSTQYQMLYDSGIIDLHEDPIHVSILFRHLTSRVSVAVDAISYFATSIAAISANLENVTLTTHNVDVRTGSLVGSPLSSSQYSTVLTFGNLDNSPAKKVSTNRIYTSSPLTGFSYKITNLVVSKNATNETLVSSSNSGTHKILTISGFTGPVSTVYRAYTYLYPGQNVAGNVWASGNLYYDKNAAPEAQYRFAEPRSSRVVESCNYYFNWNTLLPRSAYDDVQASYTTYGTGDPCSKVYPYGKWKTPSETDYNNLKASSIALEEYGTGGVQYRNTTTQTKVTFHEGGWINRSSKCGVSNEDDGQYWTSTSTSSDRANSWEVDNGLSSAGNEIEPEDKDYGLLVRCIRTN